MKGQYVEVWTYNGRIWSDTFRYDETGMLLRYLTDAEEWEPVPPMEVIEKMPDVSGVIWFAACEDGKE